MEGRRVPITIRGCLAAQLGSLTGSGLPGILLRSIGVEMAYKSVLTYLKYTSSKNETIRTPIYTSTMALYHVYARLATPPPATPEAPTPTPPPNTRHLLTCASRYHADEYFRAFETPLRLKRISAQLWDYDPVDSNVTLEQTLKDTTVDNSIRRGVMISQFPDTGATSLPEAPPQAGRDWISGRAYFIRNARQPEIYWFHPGCGDNRILASRWQKTKFIVRLSEAEEAETGTVLVRSDRVRITTASGVGEGKGMVVRKGDDSRMVVVKPSSVEAGNAEKDFRFRDLVGTFGTEWEVRDGVPNEYVTWGNPAEMHLDDWELC